MATVRMPSSLQARKTRMAISPRLAHMTFWSGWLGMAGGKETKRPLPREGTCFPRLPPGAAVTQLCSRTARPLWDAALAMARQTPDGIDISCDPTRPDVDALHAFLSRSYWS